MPIKNAIHSLSSDKSSTKVTRFQINSKIEKTSSKKVIPPWCEPIPENQNRVAGPDVEMARNVDEALQLFKDINSAKLDAQRSEEKMIKLEKKAYQAFEKRMLPILKEENPHMRHAQLLNVVAKQWKRAPENCLRKC